MGGEGMSFFSKIFGLFKKNKEPDLSFLDNESQESIPEGVVLEDIKSQEKGQDILSGTPSSSPAPGTAPYSSNLSPPNNVPSFYNPMTPQQPYNLSQQQQAGLMEKNLEVLSLKIDALRAELETIKNELKYIITYIESKKGKIEW